MIADLDDYNRRRVYIHNIMLIKTLPVYSDIQTFVQTILKFKQV
jgi:hypothetical protein